MRFKKVLSFALALTLSFGAMQFMSSAYAKEKDKPADYSGLGLEEFTCITYEKETKTLKLHGTIIPEELAHFNHYNKVEKVVTEEGTIFPEDSSFLFYEFKNATSIDLTGADTSKVTDMYDLFCNCEKAETINLGEIDTSNVTRMDLMFNNCYKLKSIKGLDKLDTSNVTNMRGMFNSNRSLSDDYLSDLYLSSFNTSKVTDMSYMFSGCEKIRMASVICSESFDVSNVKDMRGMFQGCKSLEWVGFGGNWYTSRVTNMASMFADCESLEEIRFDDNSINLDKKIDTSNVTSFENMFLNCKKLKKLDLQFTAKSAVNTSGMFMNCEGLEWISLMNFIPSKRLSSTSNMFSGCTSLNSIYVGEGWPDNFNQTVIFADNMFLDCTSLKGGNGTTYNAKNIGPQYAKIDRAGNPGYLTATGPIIPTPSSSILGDANADGTIDATDASEILSMYTKNTLNKTTPSSAELARCDVNNDGKINSVDASYVLSYYAYKQTGGTDSFVDYMANH
ncbi:BspA family leucine-rich repeat surface protein [uncultured Ruminococcus sp.]|uniref:BspA family leucine-rich repeat surface protein n=1 Tax=uncultured Ruminococcus sp. TaxID=165186 RepID=UPI0025FC56A8|nr:BspA family leucine-rich repeat surface protein [uncultured Ruminococcus sp.]